MGSQGALCGSAVAHGDSCLMCPQMNKTESLPFRTYVPQLVANLEDADAGVREHAKTAVVELFRYVASEGYTPVPNRKNTTADLATELHPNTQK